MVYADLVRQTITQTLSELGCDVSGGLQETILIRGGSYCGRRFQVADGAAVWFIEEQQLKYYGQDGALRLVCETPCAESPPATLRMPEPHVEPLRRAA